MNPICPFCKAKCIKSTTFVNIAIIGFLCRCKNLYTTYNIRFSKDEPTKVIYFKLSPSYTNLIMEWDHQEGWDIYYWDNNGESIGVSQGNDPLTPEQGIKLLNRFHKLLVFL